MSEPTVAEIQSAISFQNDKPIWDFTQTAAYPVELQQGSNKPTVYIYLSPYKSDELRDILKRAVSGYRREKQDVEIVREDKGIYTPLFDNHFVKMGNSTGTPEAQKMWFDKYPELKPAIIEYSFGYLRMEPPKSAEENDDILDISAELSGQVAVYQELYDAVTDKVVRIDMVHSHIHPTEAQYREYRSARRSKFIRRTTLWTISEQHAVLEKLYDVVVQSITGAAVNGKSCNAATKADWITSVPLWHKLWVVDQIFGELVEKNA